MLQGGEKCTCKANLAYYKYFGKIVKWRNQHLKNSTIHPQSTSAATQTDVCLKKIERDMYLWICNIYMFMDAAV